MCKTGSLQTGKYCPVLLLLPILQIFQLALSEYGNQKIYLRFATQVISSK